MLDSKFPVGMLTDTDIKAALNILFCENAEMARAKYSTYEIVLDEGFEVIEYSATGEILRIAKTPSDGLIAVAPGETVLVYSKESFSVPENVYARVNTVGQIFLAGFSAENTYVDPGFRGQVSITLINNSSRVLSMKAGSPLARVEFIKLSKSPEKIHSGRKGVRQSKVIPSVDRMSADGYKSLDFNDLIDQVEKSIFIDAIQKRSVRTDIALTRAYLKLAEEIRVSRDKVDLHAETFKRQNKLLIGCQRLAAFATATAAALWLDKFGFTDWITQCIKSIFSNNGTPTYWLNILVNIFCSVVATPIFYYLLDIYKNAKNK